jgi:WD40 repeat protein
MKTRTIVAIFVFSCVAVLMLVGVSSAKEGDTTVVLAADSAGNIFALDAPSESLLWSASVGGDARSVIVSENSEYIAVGTSSSVALLNKDGNVLWTKTVGVNPTDPTPPFQFDTRLVSISGDGGYILAGHNDGVVRLYDNNGVGIWNDSFSATSVALSTDGKKAVVGGVLGIRYYSVGSNGVWDSGDSVANWTAGGLAVRKTAISSTGSYVVAGGRSDGYVRLYNDAGTEIWNYKNLADRISVDISRDGTSVAAGNDDRTNTNGGQLAYFWIGNDNVWSVADGTPIWIFKASNDPADDVRAVAFSQNGSYIASGGSANYARTFVHRTESSTPVYTSTPGLEDETIAISPDGRYVVTADTATAAVRIYDTADPLTPLWTYNTTYSIRSVAITSLSKISNVWVPSAEGALLASAVTVTLTSGVSTCASALSDPGGFPSSGFARKVNQVFPESLKKWLHEFISSKRKLVITRRTGSPFILTKFEVLSYAVVLSVLTIAFAYAKADSLDQILPLIPTILATSIIVEFVKNFSIEVIARRQGVWTEHRVWYFGLGTFLFSAFVFKVPFSSPGRLTHHSPKFTKRSLGLASSASVIIALVFASIFYAIFAYGFTLVGNIGLVMCFTMAFFDTIPIPPMNGKDIYDWSKILWIALFTVTFALYMLCLLML